MDEERGMGEERKEYPWVIEGLPCVTGFFLFIFNTLFACFALVAIGLNIEWPASVLMTILLVIIFTLVACGFNTLVWWRASSYRFTEKLLGWKRKAILEAFIFVGGTVGQNLMGHNILLVCIFDGVCVWFISILPVMKLYYDYGVSDMFLNLAMTAATNIGHIGFWMGNILIFLLLICLRAYFNYKIGNNGNEHGGGGNGHIEGSDNGHGGGGDVHGGNGHSGGGGSNGHGGGGNGHSGGGGGNGHGGGGDGHGGNGHSGGGGGNGHGGGGDGHGGNGHSGGGGNVHGVGNEHGEGGNLGASDSTKDNRGGHNGHGDGNGHQGGNCEHGQSSTYHGSDHGLVHTRRFGRSNSAP